MCFVLQLQALDIPRTHTEVWQVGETCALLPEVAMMWATFTEINEKLFKYPQLRIFKFSIFSPECVNQEENGIWDRKGLWLYTGRKRMYVCVFVWGM